MNKHRDACPLCTFAYELGSGEAIPDCNCDGISDAEQRAEDERNFWAARTLELAQARSQLSLAIHRLGSVWIEDKVLREIHLQAFGEAMDALRMIDSWGVLE